MTTLNRRNLLIASSVALIVTPMAGLMAEGHGETVVEMLNKNPDDPKHPNGFLSSYYGCKTR